MFCSRRAYQKKQNKLGLDEVPTLNYGGKGGDGSDEEGEGAADAPVEKTLWKVKVNGFGEKAKIKVDHFVVCD